ncbi:MAG: PQQ-binding-like beta-propeller repeat protein [Candidatus Bathyarchaeota archaeon]|nr:PQQ-binding-like beta-propeller repeat protein [Candidatus Bathyarchaeota archaeon]
MQPAIAVPDSASWPMFHADPAHTGYTSANGPLTNRTLWTYQTGGDVFSSPCVVNGILYVGSDDNNVYALNASSGEKLWNYSTGDTVESSPCVVNGLLYVGSHDSNVYALNALTGTKIWNYSTGGWVISSPCVVDGVVYVSSGDSNVYALNASTGTKLWSHAAGWFGAESSPCVADGVVYLGTDHFYVYALNASTGSNIWSYDIGEYVDYSPCFADGVVYIGSGSGITADGHVTAFNASSGEKIWTYTAEHLGITADGWVMSCPSIVDGIVYVGSNNHNLYALNSSTGNLIWNYTTDGWVASSPCVANDIVYVGSTDWNIYAINASSGSKIWSYIAGSAIRSSPCMANGIVYVGSSDNKVYAFGEAEADVFYITASAGEGGSINPSGVVPVNRGGNQSFIITPDAGFSIADVQVNGVPLGPLASYKFSNLMANATIHATFSPNTYTITLNTIGSGSISRNSSEPYVYGQAVNLTASPSIGWVFSGWSGDASGKSNPETIIMDSNKTVTATFIQNAYILTVNTVGEGSVQRNATEPYSYGQVISLTANAASGWAFQGWSGDLTGKTNPDTIIMYANKTVTATFARQNLTGNTIVFTQTGLPDGTAWSVKFNNIKITSTQSTITFDNITKGTYCWAIQTPIAGTTGVRYVTKATCGIMTVPLQTSKNVTFTTQYQLTINTVGLASNHHTTIWLCRNIRGTASNNVPFIMWFNAGDHTGSIGASALIADSCTKSKFTSWNNTVDSNPHPSITMNSPVTLTANYDTKVKVTFKVTGVPVFFRGPVVNIDGYDYTRFQLPSTFWWSLSSNHTFQYYSPLSVNCNIQSIWVSTCGLSTQQAATVTLNNAGVITANYCFKCT